MIAPIVNWAVRKRWLVLLLTAIAVPQIAVQTVEGKSSVFVRTRNGFPAVPVELGPWSGDRVIITKGLKGGERIAATGSFTLKAELGKGEAEHGH